MLYLWVYCSHDVGVAVLRVYVDSCAWCAVFRVYGLRTLVSSNNFPKSDLMLFLTKNVNVTDTYIRCFALERSG